MIIYPWRNYFLVSSMLMLLWACEADQSLPPPINRTPPEIIISNPSTQRLEVLGRSPLLVTVDMADDIGLERLAVSRTVADGGGNLIESSNPLDQFIQGGSYTLQFGDTIPDLPASFQITYTFEVRNTDNQAASTQLFVVISPEDVPPSFQLFSFEGRELFSQQSGSNSAFNFSLNSLFSPSGTNTLDLDIAEATEANANNSFEVKLRSPSNALLGQDSVFVLTHADRFNFDAATYETLRGAYLSSSSHLTETPSLAVGDLVIVRLIKAPSPQFAVVKITAIFDEVGVANDRLRFDYKVSSR